CSLMTVLCQTKLSEHFCPKRPLTASHQPPSNMGVFRSRTGPSIMKIDYVVRTFTNGRRRTIGQSNPLSRICSKLVVETSRGPSVRYWKNTGDYLRKLLRLPCGAQTICVTAIRSNRI